MRLTTGKDWVMVVGDRGLPVEIKRGREFGGREMIVKACSDSIIERWNKAEKTSDL